jgi:hypothetical protein
MSLSLLRALLVLVCAAVWTHAAPAAYTKRRSHSREPPRLYRVWDEQKRVGFIDRTGRLVIGFERLSGLAFLSDFSEGLASACVADVKTGYCAEPGHEYLDVTGKVVIPPRFLNAGNFSEGLAFVYMGREEGSGFINRRGELVFRVKDGRYPSPFHEGLSVAVTSTGVEFIDHSGRVVISGPYAFAEPFSEGLAAVANGRWSGAKYGFINREGKMVIQPRFEPEREHHGFMRGLSSFSDGLACVKMDKLYGFINKQGDMVIPAEFNYRSDFSEGFACVSRQGSSTWEFIDKTGRRAFGRSFDSCGGFVEGFAPVALKTADGLRWGYIDRRGEFAIKPRFRSASPFAGGIAQVYLLKTVENAAGRIVKDGSGYIDRRGRFIWGPRWN